MNNIEISFLRGNFDMKERPLLKVCCIASVDEGLLALKQGADMLGLVSEIPSGPGVLSLTNIAKIIEELPSKSRTVLLTSALTSHAVVAQHERVRSWGVQLVDMLELTELRHLRESIPDVKIFQVIHVVDSSSIDLAEACVPHVDLLLLDSGQPDAKHRTLGGTGEVHDWNISRDICERSSIPVLLAGGLSSENIASAFHGVQPDGFDLCSGVRRDGVLDSEKLEAFTSNLNGLLRGSSSYNKRHKDGTF